MLFFNQGPTCYPKILYLNFGWCFVHFNINLVMMIIRFWITLFSSDVFSVTLNFIVFVTLWSDIPCSGSNSPVILIFVTPTFNNEIFSSKILIMLIENNFGLSQISNLLLHLLDPPSCHNKQVLGAFWFLLPIFC